MQLNLNNDNVNNHQTNYNTNINDLLNMVLGTYNDQNNADINNNNTTINIYNLYEQEKFLKTVFISNLYIHVLYLLLYHDYI